MWKSFVGRKKRFGGVLLWSMVFLDSRFLRLIRTHVAFQNRVDHPKKPDLLQVYAKLLIKKHILSSAVYYRIYAKENHANTVTTLNNSTRLRGLL